MGELAKHRPESDTGATADAADHNPSKPDPAHICAIGPSADIVHDVVNELTVILMAVNELLSGVDGPGVETSRLKDIHSAAQQAATLLRMFTTKQS